MENMCNRTAIMILHILYLPPHHKIGMIETLDLRYNHLLEELIHLQQQHQMVVVQLLSDIQYSYIIDLHGVN